MDATTLSISLELELAEESLTGRAVSCAGVARGFSGWLELLGAIDALVHAGPAAGQPENPLPKEIKP